MFASNNLELYHSQLIKLTDKEQSKLAAYLQFIGYYYSASKQKAKDFYNTLEKYSPREIYVFSENSAVFKKFIQLPGCPLTKSWPEFLARKGYFGSHLTAVDKSLEHSIYEQFVGAYLFSDYSKKAAAGNRIQALGSLDLACNYGLFQALIERCSLCKEKIKTTTDDKERVIALGQLMADIKVLSKLYGSVGYLHAALALVDIGNYYNKLEDVAFASVARVFHKAAAESFFCARELLGHELTENEKVIKTIGKDEGLAIYGFANWSAAEQFFLERLDNSVASHAELLEAARKTINKLLNLNEIPKPT